MLASKSTYNHLRLDSNTGGSVVKNAPANAGDTGVIPGPGRPPHAAEQLTSCNTTTEPVF